MEKPETLSSNCHYYFIFKLSSKILLVHLDLISFHLIEHTY